MNIYLAIFLSFLLALFAFFKKSFTYYGLSTAFLISIVICYCGNYPAFLGLMGLFLITVITDKFKKEQKEKIEKSMHDKGSKRDFWQIISNLLIATISIIIYKITLNSIFMLAFYISLANSAADTSASGIGILSNKCFNILTFKPATKGLSGNISILGLVSSLVAALMIGIISLLFKISVINVLTVTLFGFIGALIDSFLGCFQVKYYCEICKVVTEKQNHCNNKTKYYNGFKFLNNDIVNFISNLFSTLLYIVISF